MAGEKKTKSGASPKAEAALKEGVAKTETPIKSEGPAKQTGKETGKEPATVADGTGPESSPKSDAAPTRYSRGEGQKAVTQAYKDNWNDIFGAKTKTKSVKPKSAKPKLHKPKSAKRKETKPKAIKSKAIKKKPATKKKR